MLSSSSLPGGGVENTLQRTGMWNEAGAHQLAHHHGQVGGDGHHPVLQVVVELRAILWNLNHLEERENISLAAERRDKRSRVMWPFRWGSDWKPTSTVQEEDNCRHHHHRHVDSQPRESGTNLLCFTATGVVPDRTGAGCWRCPAPTPPFPWRSQRPASPRPPPPQEGSLTGRCWPRWCGRLEKNTY